MEAKPPALKFHIRWMIRHDLPAVVKIEAAAYPPDQVWSVDGFLKYLRQRNAIGMVAECNDQIVGYFVYTLAPAYLSVKNFTVDPAYQRLGVGRAMCDKLVNKLGSHKRQSIRLCVRETNLRAQLFFKSQLFRATKVVKEKYPNGEDGFMMRRLRNPPRPEE